MKRRDFIRAAGLTGIALPALGRAAAPCPTPQIWIDDDPPVNTECVPPPPPGTAPSWFVNMPDKTWTMIAAGSSRSDLSGWQRGSRVADVFPSSSIGGNGPRYVCEAWNGACVAQDRGELILAANGGHGNYAGNEVYACDIRGATPRWTRLTNPSVASGGSESNGDYGDGRMRSVHGWHRCTWGAGKVWYAGMDGMYVSGMWSTRCWSFDRNALGDGPFPVANAPWRNLGLGLPQSSGVNGEAGCASYDRVGNRVWSSVGAYANSAGQSFYSINCATNAISQHDFALQGGRPRWCALAHDLRVWVLGCPYEGKLELVDLANPVRTINSVPTGSPSGLEDGVGAVYHQRSRAIFCWDGYGGNIRKLSIPSNPLTGTYTWSQVTPASGNPVSPSAPSDTGTYSKFNLIEDMGNGQSALVVINKTDEPVYVFKLPVAGA